MVAPDKRRGGGGGGTSSSSASTTARGGGGGGGSGRRRPPSLARRLVAIVQDCYACAVGSVVVLIMMVGFLLHVLVLPLWLCGLRVAYERVSAVLCQAMGAPIFMYVIYVTKLRGFQYGDEYFEPGYLHKHVMVMNHQSWVDVPFFLGLFFFTAGVNSSRWVCWRSLLKFPMIWAAYMKGDVFIPCVWERDQPLLARSIDWFCKSPLARTYVFFPEGAIKRRSTMAKSVAYCQDIGVEPLRHLLYPRHKALKLVVDALRSHHVGHLPPSASATGASSASASVASSLRQRGAAAKGGTGPSAAIVSASDGAALMKRADGGAPRFSSLLSLSDGYLYDVTVGYEGFGGRPPRMLDCFIPRGRPLGVHMHFRRFLLSSLPRDEAELAAWVQKLYRQKDELLECFRVHGAFPTAANGHGPIGPLRERRPPDWRGVWWLLAFVAIVGVVAGLAYLCAMRTDVLVSAFATTRRAVTDQLQAISG